MFILVAGLLSYAIYNQHEDIQKVNEENWKLQLEISNLNLKYAEEQAYADSVERSNKILGSQRQLTEAMAFRDSVSRELKHKVGDLVLIKVDSSKVVISDIVIGGSRHNYYIKYVVQHADRSFETLLPEMVF